MRATKSMKGCPIWSHFKGPSLLCIINWLRFRLLEPDRHTRCSLHSGHRNDPGRAAPAAGFSDSPTPSLRCCPGAPPTMHPEPAHKNTKGSAFLRLNVGLLCTGTVSPRMSNSCDLREAAPPPPPPPPSHARFIQRTLCCELSSWGAYRGDNINLLHPSQLHGSQSSTFDCALPHEAFGASRRYTVILSAKCSGKLLPCTCAPSARPLGSSCAGLSLEALLRAASTIGNSLCCCNSRRSCTANRQLQCCSV